MSKSLDNYYTIREVMIPSTSNVSLVCFGLRIIGAFIFLQVLQQLKDKALRSAGVTEDDVLRSIEERMLAHKNKGFSKGDQFWCYFCLFLILIFSAFVFIISVSNLRWNKLQDSIPPEIGDLKQPTHLYLSFNNFKGKIPKELANLPELRYLQLHENRLIGRIPAELGTLPNLRHLDVGNNHLIGTIRELIRIDGCFPALRNLYLNNNYLAVGIPSQLSNLTKLEILYLSYNKMSRVVPFGVAHIPRLTYLYLDHNQFSRRIPETFYKHPFLKKIGYMPPEYIIYGKISVKTVVYSFGIILKIANDTKYFPTEVRQDILEDVWKLWTEGRAIDLVDDSMDASGQD
ncbi:hypothetical protein ACS0TY_009699 [Phlomoides rotata]